MSFFRQVLDLGFDYGATGGPQWDDEITANLAKRELRVQMGEDPQRRYELGNRQVLRDQHDYLRDFHMAMRGRRHSFLYKDWSDYQARNEPLALDGTTTTQLTRTYGAAINPYIREIQYIEASSFVLELDTGAGFVEQVPTTDYTVDPDTGIITWVSAPDAEDDARWSGIYFVRVRFDARQFASQFLVIDDDGEEGYAIGSLPLVEDLGEL